MSELINEKYVLVALGRGKSVQYKYNEPHKSEWLDLKPSGWCLIDFLEENSSGKYLFRLKPRTIKLNGIELPSVKYVAHSGGNCVKISCKCPEDAAVISAALRSVFNPK